MRAFIRLYVRPFVRPFVRLSIELVAVTLLTLALVQCGSRSDNGSLTASDGCLPGSVRRCEGTWSCKGDQRCSADGKQWTACVCDATVTGTGYDASPGLDASAEDVPTAGPALRYILLDDLENPAAPDGPIPFSVGGDGPSPGFWGSWRSSGDPSNFMAPEPYVHAALPASHPTLDGVTSTRAAHLACRVADVYGYCELGVWLAQRTAGADAGAASPEVGRPDMMNRIPVDLSAYEGLVFWAMASKATRLKVVVENADTDALGGQCGQTDASTDQCGDAFSRQISLTDSWKRYEVKFKELSQDGWGHPAPSGKLDPRTVYLIGFQIDGPQSDTAAPVETDFWIDDLYVVQSVQDPGLSDATAPDGPPSRCLSGSDELIADFQDDVKLSPGDGRRGSFYVNGDGKGHFEPPKVENSEYPIDLDQGNSQCSGPGSFHTKAIGFADWGAAISTDFMAKSGATKGTYDASKYRGVSFWAKASAPLTGVKVSFPDIYTDGGADPSSVNPAVSPCVFESGSKYNCSPYLVKLGDSDFPSYKTAQIDTTWRRFDILFADTQQDFFNPGFHPAENRLDTKHLTSMAIQIGTLYVNDSAQPNDFEIWIDDVYFIK